MLHHICVYGVDIPLSEAFESLPSTKNSTGPDQGGQLGKHWSSKKHSMYNVRQCSSVLVTLRHMTLDFVPGTGINWGTISRLTFPFKNQHPWMLAKLQLATCCCCWIMSKKGETSETSPIQGTGSFTVESQVPSQVVTCYRPTMTRWFNQSKQGERDSPTVRWSWESLLFDHVQ